MVSPTRSRSCRASSGTGYVFRPASTTRRWLYQVLFPNKLKPKCCCWAKRSGWAGRLLAILRLRGACGSIGFSSFLASAGTNWAKVSRTRTCAVVSATGCRRNRGNPGLGRRRGNDRGQAGVVDYPFRRFLVGADPHHGLVDRRGSIAGHGHLLGGKRIKGEQQREQNSADKQEITRYWH